MKLFGAIAIAIPCLAHAGTASIAVDWAGINLITLTGSAQKLYESGSYDDFFHGTVMAFESDKSVRGAYHDAWLEPPFDASIGENYAHSSYGVVSARAINGGWAEAQATDYGGGVQVAKLSPLSSATFELPFTYLVDASSKFDRQSGVGYMFSVAGDPFGKSKVSYNASNGIFDVIAFTGQKFDGQGTSRFLLENFSATNDAYFSMSMFLDASASTISPVPEPETYSMMMVGLGAVGFLARRRLKNKAKSA